MNNLQMACEWYENKANEEHLYGYEKLTFITVQNVTTISNFIEDILYVDDL